MRNMRTIFCSLLLGGSFFFASTQPASATDKNVIALQVQVQQLQDALARLQQSSDERWALTKATMDSNTDSLNRIATALNALQQQIAAQSDTGQQQQLSSQIQSTHDAVDEVKARLSRLEKLINDMQGQLNNLPAQGAPQTAAPSGPPQGQAMPQEPLPQQQSDAQLAQQEPAPAPQTAAAPPVRELYQAAYRDYTGARYDLSSQEFQQVIQAYPQDDLAGNAQFYLGEIAYRQGHYRDAAKAYDAVLQNYPGNAKSSVALLRKGDSLIQIGKRQEGINDLRALISRYPQSPEAVQARSTLNGMGVNPTPHSRAVAQ